MNVKKFLVLAKLRFFLKMFVLLKKLSELLKKWSQGFFNLSVGEDWDCDWSLYEQDLTYEEFGYRVCGHPMTDEEENINE